MSDRRKLFGKVIIAGEEFDFIKAANIKEVSLEYYKTRNLRNNKKYGIEIIKKEILRYQTAANSAAEFLRLSCRK